MNLGTTSVLQPEKDQKTWQEFWTSGQDAVLAQVNFICN
jgi:hypothetical protein